MPEPITLKDVAREIGVSYQTVWRAVHDKPGILPSTRTQVLEAAARMGYRRNRLAGGLRTSRSATIGLVVLDVSNPYTGKLTNAIETAAAARGISVLLMNSADQLDRERDAVAALLERRVDGLIINPCSEGNHRYLRDDLPAGMPLVAINMKIPGVPSATVASKHTDVAAAARHLVERGNRRIGAIFGTYTNLPFLYRSRALRAELTRLGVPVDDGCIRVGENSVEFARAAVVELLDQPDPPTGLFAAGNRLTEGMLLGLRDLGIRHGHDVDVVGFDLRYAELLDPPMPVLVQPAREMGELALDVLLRMIAGEPAPKLRPLPIDFVIPEPTGAATAGAPRRGRG